MSIPQEGSRDIGDGIIVSLTPDVCKTPVGSSMVPVPYSITAKQADDANTVATVRMTKKRAHNMASLVTKSTGDQPGTGTGIKSGTVGSVCHPKTHSGTVRIRGEYAIRNDDMWEMNNRNTVGKLVYVRTKETFEETPAVTQNNTPGTELPPGSYQVADMSGWGSWFAPPEPEVLPEIEIPGAPQQPGPIETLPIPEDNRNRRPPSQPPVKPSWNPIITQLRLMREAARSLERQRQIYEDWANKETITVRRPDGTFEEVHPDEMKRRMLEEMGFDDEDQFNEWLKEQEEAETLTDTDAEVTDENVRIEGEEEEPDPCEVKRYGSLNCPSGEQAHHIVPDSLLRYGNRPDGEAGLNRISGMPSFRDGMAICLTGQASDPTSGHGIAHSVTDPMVAAAGAAAPIPGTTTLGTGVAAGIAGASAAKPECTAQITAAATQQFGGIGQGRLVNAANRPARGAALDALRQGL